MSFLVRLSRIFIWCALVCLAAAGLSLAVSHDPEHYQIIAQAEALGAFAYSFLIIALLLELVARVWPKGRIR